MTCSRAALPLSRRLGGDKGSGVNTTPPDPLIPFAESAEDCQRVLKLNPYHVGAISGLAQCQIQLNQPHEALRTLRRAAKRQPHSPSIRENIQVLEAQIESDGTR